jgi:4-hydroxybenzoate polyprenyltransferase
MSRPLPSTDVPPGFLIGVFVAAGLIGAVIAYLGITGAIGVPIP